MGSSTSSDSQHAINVAIIGGGITGMTLGLGLQARGIKYKIYERASGFHEIGAGVGFSANAERAMKALNVDIHKAFKKVANPNGEDYFQWIDGHSTGKLMSRLYLGEGMFEGCRRSDFIDELAKLIPPECVVFDKQADFMFTGEDRRPNVTFKDGDCITADVVVGCDGIRSRIRQLMFGEKNPVSHAGYTHQYCFRSLVGMHEAINLIGQAKTPICENAEYLTSTRFMYNGPDGHIITYPVAMGTLLNVLAVISDPKEWDTVDRKHTTKTTKQEAVDFFKSWYHPTVKAIVDLLPDELEKWAIFDMLDHPAEKYHTDHCVCIAGDAAHASGPHLGAGAGFGIEDALVLATALDYVNREAASKSDLEKVDMCSAALSTYNDVRYERTQWLVGATREACDLFQFRSGDEYADDHYQVFEREISALFHNIWDVDIEAMVEDTVGGMRNRVKRTQWINDGVVG